MPDAMMKTGSHSIVRSNGRDQVTCRKENSGETRASASIIAKLATYIKPDGPMFVSAINSHSRGFTRTYSFNPYGDTHCEIKKYS